MLKVHLMPNNIVIEGEKNQNLLHVLQQHHITLPAHCGGNGKCSSCMVEVNGKPIQACRTILTESLTVKLPIANKSTMQIMVDSKSRKFTLNPRIKKQYVTRNGKNLTFCLYTDPFDNKESLVNIEAGDTRDYQYGIALDIGTTTVVAYLHNLLTGELVGLASKTNTQTTYGADIISRISYTQKKATGLISLHRAIINLTNELIDELTVSHSINRNFIYNLVVVGNSTMMHLFLNISPQSLGVAPYIPIITKGLTIDAKDVGLSLPYTKVNALPNLGGYIGSDTLAVILASEIHKTDDYSLAIDIGTNGEMAIGNKNKLIVCSSPAGPAFEGGQISKGMQAEVGAISKVYFEYDVHLEVIGGTNPKGICGSGLVDIVAELLRIGMINETGAFKRKEDLSSTIPIRLRERLIDGKEGHAFLLASGMESDSGEPLLLTQKDIRELQLAKAAISSGIELLLQRAELSYHQIKHLYLAGGFGNYIDKYNAICIGLIPNINDTKIISIGNGAGYGARLALLSKEEMREALSLTWDVEQFHLAEDPRYESVFLKELSFPK